LVWRKGKKIKRGRGNMKNCWKTFDKVDML